MQRLEKANKVAKLVVSSYATIGVFSILTFLALAVIMLETNDIDYNALLKEIGNVNITVAIGLGALAVAISKQFLKTDFIKTALVMLTLGILSFVLSYTSIDTYSLKAYFYINVLFSVFGIATFSYDLKNISKEQKKDSSNTSENISNRSKNEK